MRLDGRVADLLLPGETPESAAEVEPEAGESQFDFATTELVDTQTLISDDDSQLLVP